MVGASKTTVFHVSDQAVKEDFFLSASKDEKQKKTLLSPVEVNHAAIDNQIYIQLED